MQKRHIGALLLLFVALVTFSVLSSALTLKFLIPNILSEYQLATPTATSVSSEVSQDLVATSSLRQVESGVKSVAGKLKKSVVNIVISKDIQLYRTDPFGFFYEPSGTERRKVGGGTGFFITADGLILTNKHVVSEPNATYSIITGDNEEFSGKVLAVDPLTDLALVQAVDAGGKNISGRTPVEFINDTKAVDVGTFVIAMGNALAEFQNTLTFGIISGLGRTIQAGNQAGGNVEQLSGLFQTDAAINPGNSGGPLVNLDGKVIGINTAIAAGANGLGFAIPLSERDVDYLKKSLQKYHAIKRPFLGIRYAPVDANIARANKLPVEYGDIIVPDGIVAGSPAERAGLKSGDVIVEADGKSLRGRDLRDVLAEKMPGDSVSLRVRSGEDSRTVTIILGSL